MVTMGYIEISMDKVKVGMSIHLELSWWEHPFLHNNFRLKSHGDIEELKKCGIKKVFFDPEKSKIVEEMPPAIPSHSFSPSPASESSKPNEISESREVRGIPKKYQSQFMQEWQKKFLQKEREYSLAYNQVSHIMNNLEANKNTSMQWAHELLRDITDAFFQESDSIVYLINIKENDDIAYFHSLNTSILSMLLGKTLGFLRTELKELGMSALFHDIGKLRIPKKVWMKKPPLTRAEKKYLELHPQYGVAMLHGCETVYPGVLDTIHQHHETRDGKGYPQKLFGNQISLFAKIVAIVDLYDNICNQKALGSSLTPHETLSYIFARLGGELEPDIIAAFVKSMGVYPPGTLVKLTDESMAMVISSDREKSMKPTVLLYSDSVPRETPIVINLGEQEELAIDRSLHTFEVPPEVLAYLEPGKMSGFFVLAYTDPKKREKKNPFSS